MAGATSLAAVEREARSRRTHLRDGGEAPERGLIALEKALEAAEEGVLDARSADQYAQVRRQLVNWLVAVFFPPETAGS